MSTTRAARWPGIVRAGRAALAAVFVWAALPKLIDPSALATAIENYRVLPAEWAGLAAGVLPVFEFGLAVGLLGSRLARGASLLAALLLGSFTVAMAQARLRGIDLECGCFGASLEAAVSWWTVARSALLCAFATLLFVLSSRVEAASARGAAAHPPVISS